MARRFRTLVATHEKEAAKMFNVTASQKRKVKENPANYGGVVGLSPYTKKETFEERLARLDLELENKGITIGKFTPKVQGQKRKNRKRV